MFESVDEILRCAKKKKFVQKIQEVTFPYSDWQISIHNLLCFLPNYDQQQHEIQFFTRIFCRAHNYVTVRHSDVSILYMYTVLLTQVLLLKCPT